MMAHLSRDTSGMLLIALVQEFLQWTNMTYALKVCRACSLHHAAWIAGALLATFVLQSCTLRTHEIGCHAVGLRG